MGFPPLAFSKVLRLCFSALLAFAASAGAQDLPTEFRFNDAGRPRAFRLVTDVVATAGPDGRDTYLAVPPPNATVPSSAADALVQRRRVALDTGRPAWLVVDEIDAAGRPVGRRIVRPEVVAISSNPAVTDTAARALGLRPRPAFTNAPARFLVYTADSSEQALTAAAALGARMEVTHAAPGLARQQQRRLIPNDTLFSSQWHLVNSGQSGGIAGTDVNVSSVWDTRLGDGVRIAIVDDGLQTTHPDLSPNIDPVATNHHNWNGAPGTVNDPNPNTADDYHGTACAGVAAARGGNGLGVSGAAPRATLVGLRLIAAATTDAQEAEAIAWKNDVIPIKSNSWGPGDDGKTLEAPGPLAAAAFAQAATTGRGGLGTIFVWAGGNGGDVGDNSNYDGYANSIYTIAIAALTNKAQQSYYSEPGANLIVTAPSNGSGTDLGITTVDLIGDDGYNATGVSGNHASRDYTNDFGGTSSAAPLAAGVIALILQANPQLGWRDVQEILLKSATQVAPSDSDWITNAAGFRFNHKYGAGLINGAAAVGLATSWTNLPVATSQTLARSSLSQSIPDNNSAGTSVTFDLSAQSNLRIEQATVTLTIAHANRGQIAVTLTSPTGTVSRLAEKHTDSAANYSAWTFMTVRNWGESSQGVWTLTVSDLAAGTTGSVTSAALTVYGTPAAPLNRRPAVTAAILSPGPEAFAELPLAVAGLVANDPEADAITYAYQWQLSSDGATFADIAGATAAILAGDSARAGLLVRCRVTASDAGGAGAAFLTEPRALNRRPPIVARTGALFTYDSELFVTDRSATFSRAALINEFSQGSTGAKEWVELITLAPTTDLRGWTLADSNSGTLTFSQNALWAALPAGTLVVVYNGADRDSVLPADRAVLDASKTLVIAHNNAAFFSGNWPGLSNSSAEFLALATALGASVDGVSFNANTIHSPALGSVGSATAAAYQGGTDAGADLLANWAKPSAGSATPGAGNGGANSAFVADLRAGALNQPATFRFGASSVTPLGLAIDAATGVVSGTHSATPGVYILVIERTNGVDVASQTLPLLVVGADGVATIPTGQTWRLNRDAALPGSLTVMGTLDLAGFELTVLRTLTNSGGTVVDSANRLRVVTLSGTQSLAAGSLGYTATATAAGTVTLAQTLTFSGSVANLAWQLSLPVGWSYASGAGAEGDVKPAAGAGGLLEWKWTAAQVSPLVFQVTLSVPAGTAGAKTVGAAALLYAGDSAVPLQVAAQPESLSIGPAELGPRHNADTNADGALSLVELTRVIELYNTSNGTLRTGRYIVATTPTVDGFAPEPGVSGAAGTLATYHTADTNSDGRFALHELTRVIELFNARSGSVRTGRYHAQASTEDGFAPGP